MGFTRQTALQGFASWVGATIQRRALTDGIKLENITVCYNEPGSAEIACMVFPLICDKDSEGAAMGGLKSALVAGRIANEDSEGATMEGLKSGLVAFIEKCGGEKCSTVKRDIFYTEKLEEFFGALSEEEVGTGIYFPIAVLRRMTGGRFVPSPMPYAYFGIGVVGGTQEQNKSLILKILPDFLTEMKKYDKTLSLPRALFYNTKA